MAANDFRPKTFFLNEQHELAHGERPPGGRTPRYASIDWKDRGAKLSGSLRNVQKVLSASLDPTKSGHYFLLTRPQKEIVKLSENKKLAPDGLLRETVRFDNQQSKVFGKLDMDLLQVLDDGSAVIHLLPTTLDKLARTTETLDTLGSREQARWVAFDEFQEIPSGSRLDGTWGQGLSENSYADAVIEFQPFLTRVEIDNLLRSIVNTFKNAGERIYSTGTDFSGRQWLRGAVLPASLRQLAETYFSIESLHSPLIAHTALSAGDGFPAGNASPVYPVSVGQLPIIGVVDTGIPANHVSLTVFRRGTYVGPNSYVKNPDPHGTFVASRIVFDDLKGPPSPNANLAGTALFYDINICGINAGQVDTKSLYPALQAVTSTAPDVRVFNCSFDTSPLPSMSEVERTEFLNLVRDLDNFIFQNDILVIFSAGNSKKGIVPQTVYPGHGDEAPWQLGAWARSFNSLTCGSLVGSLSSSGYITNLGWPSAFCRVGPV